LMTSKRNATATGGATSGDTAIGVRTALRAASAGGVGTETADRLVTSLRTATAAGAGSEIIVTVRTTFDSGTASGVGDIDVALWFNRGQPLDAVIKTRPIQFEHPGKRPFRRNVNYSVNRRR
jgi:hypothetical protein